MTTVVQASSSVSLFVPRVAVPFIYERERAAHGRGRALALVLDRGAELRDRVELGADVACAEIKFQGGVDARIDLHTGLSRGQIFSISAAMSARASSSRNSISRWKWRLLGLEPFPAQCVSQGTVEGDALAYPGVPFNAAETGHPVFRSAAVVSRAASGP